MCLVCGSVANSEKRHQALRRDRLDQGEACSELDPVVWVGGWVGGWVRWVRCERETANEKEKEKEKENTMKEGVAVKVRGAILYYKNSDDCQQRSADDPTLPYLPLLQH